MATLKERIDALAVRIAQEIKAERMPRGYTPPSGMWINPTNILTVGSVSALSGVVHWTPIDIGPDPLTISNIGISVGTPQSGGSVTVTLGLYADDGTGGRPLMTVAGLLASGNVVVTSAGYKTVASSLTLPPGRYWSAFLYVQTSAPSTSPTFQGPSNAVSMWGVGPGTTSRALTSPTGRTTLPTSAVTLGTTNANTVAVALQAA